MAKVHSKKAFSFKFPNKVLLLILFSIIAPLIIYSFYEITSLKKSEELIANTYRTQLNYIHFTLNQYSNDLAADVFHDLATDEGFNDQDLNLALPASCIQGKGQALLHDEGWNWEHNYLGTYQAKVDSLLYSKDELLVKLISFLDANYSKVQTLPFSKDYTLWLSLHKKDGQKYMTVILLNSHRLITEVLYPRMQTIGQGEFGFEVKQASSQELVIQTEAPKNALLLFESPLWLVDGYSLHVFPIAETFVDITQKRSKANLYILIALNVLLVLGSLLIFYINQKDKRLNRLKSDFVSNISHELRTPLTLIKMYSETLMDGRLTGDDKKKKYYSVIHEESNRLIAIVNRILSFSKLESKHQRYNIKPTDLNYTISSFLDLYKQSVEEKGFELKTEFQSNLPLVNIDEEAITEVLLNLLDNAVKYSRENKSIRFITSLENRSVCFSVVDQGIGLSDEDKQNIFKKFYRAPHDDISNQVSGSGLGLAIVKQIIEDHQGTIAISSQVGQGSQFKISFPISPIN